MNIHKEWINLVVSRQLLAPPVLMAVFLIAVEQISPLGFHTLAELFAIVISFVMFAFAWFTRGFFINSFLLFLACGYFWIGSLDLMHALVYKDMNVFVEGSGNLSVQFWISTRYAEAILLLVAPFFIARKASGYSLIVVFGSIAAGLAALILSGNFPTGFVEGEGLTPFKIYSEYLIILLLALALYILHRRGENISSTEKTFISISIILTMCAELAFTFYVSVYGISIIAGHILKLFSFWFIFQAIVISNLRKPYFTMRASENKYRSLFDSMTLGVVYQDAAGRITSVNQAGQKFLGMSLDQMRDKALSDPCWKVINEDGETFSAENHPASVAFKTRENVLGVVMGVFHPVKKEYRWFIVDAVPQFEIDGRTPSHVFSTFSDITERRQIEKQLLHAQKMEAMGQLTGGIAHDFNNVLGIVMGNFEILQRMFKGDEKALGRVSIGLKAAKRGADLTRKLLNFSRKGTEGTKTISVSKLIREMEYMLVKSLTVAINVDFRLKDNLWPVSVDPGDFQDVVINLALNARDSMPDGGELVIEADNKVLDKNYVQQNPQARAGEFVMLSVSDTGQGMSAAVRDRALEPFFTTKAEGKGTGLGLSMVYGFVQRAGGHIKIYSEPGKGTTFRIYLPRAYEPGTERKIKAQVADLLPRGHETILIVDDEEFLVTIAVSQLQDLGYRTLSANDAAQALEVLQGDEKIDLLFSDVIMPGEMDGYQLAKHAVDAHKDLKILLTSGFTNKREHSFGENEAFYTDLASNLLSKPYNQSELAIAVRQVIDS